MSLADHADNRRQTPNYINYINRKLKSLRNNAACCIRLRDLRNLRENNHARALKQSAQTKPQCLPQISLIYADIAIVLNRRFKQHFKSAYLFLRSSARKLCINSWPILNFTLDQ